MRRTLLMIAAVALLLTQCRKPSIDFPTPSETTTVNMTITAGPGSKTDISTEGGIVWSANDKIYVGDGTKCIGCLSIVGGMGNPTGTFTGEVTATTGTNKTFHFYYLGNAKDYSADLASHNTYVDVSFAEQEIYAEDGKLKNASGQHVGYGKVEGVDVEADTPITGLQVSMKSKVAIAYFCFQKGEGESATPYTGALTLSGTNIYNKMTVKFNASDFYFTPVKDGDISLANMTTHLKYAMLVPAGTSAATLTFGGGAEGTTVLENGIEANKFYRIDGSMPIVVNVTPKPKFTVDDLGTTVEFAPGNLYYDGTACKWKFEANQWDFRTYNGNGSCINGTYNPSGGTPANDWGLFGWSGSTASAEYGMSTSTTDSDYSGDFKDWGGLAIGGYEADTWHTLTRDEWNYLLGYDPEEDEQTDEYGRPGAKGLCALVTLTDVNVYGLVILPDDSTVTASSVTTTTAVASNGAVFLPAAGDRSGTSVSNVGVQGIYWSSTPCDFIELNAWYVCFSDYVDASWPASVEYGHSVRLVR